MEMYEIDGDFFEDPIEYLEYHMDCDKEELETYEDDFMIEAYECDLEPLVVFTPELIVEMIDEERFSEDGVDREAEKITKALQKHINFEALNTDMPKLWYPSRRKIRWTKDELLKMF